MPSKFAEFALPKGAEALRTDKEGYAAMEQAGRRIGSLYGQAASDYAAIGKLEDEAFRAQDFPFDFAAFSSGSTRQAGGGGGGFNFKVSNAGSGFGGTTGGGSGGGGSTPRAERSAVPSQRGQTVAAAARLIDGWGNATAPVGTSILHGDRSQQNAGGPVDVGQGGLTDPFSTNYRDALGDNPTRESNWNYSPEAVTREPLPGSMPASAPESSGGIGQFFSDLYSSVSSAVSSAGAAGYSISGEE